ncbi:hypothetical protein [Exiguobacterium sp. s154]|nr:hypothetical protein [Exiguobacterium sp. s154]
MKKTTARQASTLILSGALLIQAGVPMNALAEPTTMTIDGSKTDWTSTPALATSPATG